MPRKLRGTTINESTRHFLPWVCSPSPKLTFGQVMNFPRPWKALERRVQGVRGAKVTQQGRKFSHFWPYCPFVHRRYRALRKGWDDSARNLGLKNSEFCGNVSSLSHIHHFKWWFGLAIIKAGYMHAQKEGYRKRCCWPAYKAVLLESSFLDSSACSLIYLFIASSVILTYSSLLSTP